MKKLIKMLVTRPLAVLPALDYGLAQKMICLTHLQTALNTHIGILPACAFEGLSPSMRVLDVGCGAGQWAREAARHAPGITVIGVENHETLMYLAEREAVENGIQNVSFDVGSILSLPYGASFDLVHLALQGCAVAAKDWPPLLTQCWNACRPGGWFVWTEATFPSTSSQALEHLFGLLTTALIERGIFPDVSERMQNLLCWLPEGSFQQVQIIMDAIDLSSGSPVYKTLVPYVVAFLSWLAPYWHDLVTRKEAEMLRWQLLYDVLRKHFCGELWVRTLVARKPGGEEQLGGNV